MSDFSYHNGVREPIIRREDHGTALVTFGLVALILVFYAIPKIIFSTIWDDIRSIGQWRHRGWE